MRALRPVMLALGVLAVLMGLLWVGQGLGYIHWPASSFMLDQREWAAKGALVAVVGVVLIVLNRPKRVG
ncbi:hypothetical protein QH494_13520 [Sphingomonas sp. AR_OL41]|uniref:hypothetical protein n=1 Tax=Sphingomonas sp. AR_OL41 TaxID=3042729 RepID=UPI002480EE65|nr:hypothetical protein [Sphingomonas sp. AR_OL41]MDH7973202.1 hypothetical protein [Sphingomonas sp. AR_OL41]